VELNSESWGRGEAVIGRRVAIDVVRSPARSPALKRDCSELKIAERQRRMSLCSRVAMMGCRFQSILCIIVLDVAAVAVVAVVVGCCCYEVKCHAVLLQFSDTNGRTSDPTNTYKKGNLYCSSKHCNLYGEKPLLELII
jgi:hypothetical protein